MDTGLIAAPFLPNIYENQPLYKRSLATVVGLVDLPISLVTDTVFLPYDAWIYKPRKYSIPEYDPNQTIKADEK